METGDENYENDQEMDYVLMYMYQQIYGNHSEELA